MTTSIQLQDNDLGFTEAVGPLAPANADAIAAAFGLSIGEEGLRLLVAGHPTTARWGNYLLIHPDGLGVGSEEWVEGTRA